MAPPELLRRAEGPVSSEAIRTSRIVDFSCRIHIHQSHLQKPILPRNHFYRGRRGTRAKVSVVQATTVHHLHPGQQRARQEGDSTVSGLGRCRPLGSLRTRGLGSRLLWQQENGGWQLDGPLVTAAGVGLHRQELLAGGYCSRGARSPGLRRRARHALVTELRPRQTASPTLRAPLWCPDSPPVRRGNEDHDRRCSSFIPGRCSAADTAVALRASFSSRARQSRALVLAPPPCLSRVTSAPVASLFLYSV